jgi:magnesium transporter
VIRGWIADSTGVREAAPQEALEAFAAGRGAIWLDFCQEPEHQAVRILEGLHIHPLVLEAMTSHLHRPKVDDYGRYLYLVLHAATWEARRPVLQELDMVVGDKFLVTYRDNDMESLAAAHDLLRRRPDLLANGAAPLLHFVLDTLVDQYLVINDRIGDELDELEERALEEPGFHIGRDILRLKRGISAMRRVIGPQRDTVLALTRDEFRAIPAEMRPYLRDVYDRLARAGDLIESFRDETASLLELQTAMTSNRLNEVIKRLTVIATIGLPLTLITGFYGMNFRFAEYEFRHPWIFVGSLLVISGLGVWWFLKRQDWL